jgi:hypothetical protein
MNHDNIRLRRALFANAAFSGTTGLTALALAPVLAESLGPPTWALRSVGAGLVAFAALVAREGRSPGRAGTIQVIAADAAWIVAAILLIAIAPTWLTGIGRATLAAVTLVVAAAATAQWRGLRAGGSVRAVRSPDVELSGAPGDGV